MKSQVFHTTVRQLCAAVVTLVFMATSALGQSAKTYKWLDDNKQEHESSLYATATNVNQMKALVATVYADNTIPGLRYYLKNTDGAEDPITYEIVKGYTGSTSTIKNSELYAKYNQYSPFLQKGLNFNTKTETKTDRWGNKTTYTYEVADITPDHGMTVLLVEMKDDYKAQTIKETELDKSWDYIKSITVLDEGHILKTGEDKKSTDGYLVNINRPLNKFFLIVKGDNYENHRARAPFYEGYEQISPADGQKSVDNAYATMVKGEKYPAEHNCMSVFVKAHAMMMYDKDCETGIQANMLVYIPNGRLIDGGSSKTKYNIYINDETHGDLRPYFFIPTIKLTATDSKKYPDHVATITNTWTSSIKGTTNDKLNERFRLRRSYDGVNWEDVPAADFLTVTPTEAQLDKETGYITLNKSTVTVTLHEPQYPQEHDVYFQVFDRYADTNFDEIESEICTVTIPGYEFTNPTLTIKLDHKSVFDKVNQLNKYTNKVDFVLQAEDANGLKNENVKTDGDILNLELHRYTDAKLSTTEENFGIDKGVKIADVVIERTKPEASDNGRARAYTVTVTAVDANGKKADKASYTGELVAKDLEQLHINGAYKGGDIWGYFIDEFNYNIAETGKADASTYSYRLFATNADNVRDGNENLTEEPIRSNVPMAAMPGMDHGTGFIDYSLDQIKGDTEGTLELSVPQVKFTPQSQAEGLDLCKIEFIEVGDNENIEVATAEKTKQGMWVLKSYTGDEKKLAAGALNTSVAVGVAKKAMGRTTVMTIYYGGNTYGTPHRLIPYLPVVNVTGFKLKWEGDHYNTEAKLTVKVDNDDAAKNFRSHGYGVWHNEGTVELYDSKDDINVLRHHKHAADLDNGSFTFAYNKAHNSTVDVYEGGEITGEEANATIKDVRTATRGTHDAPYALWYRVRYYAQYISPNAEEGAAPRYVVVENHNGAREEGDGNTTGAESIVADDDDSAAEYYNLQGVRMPAETPLAPGIYIRRTTTSATKVIIR